MECAVSQPVGRSRRWATKTLAKQKNPANRTVPNAFPKVALPWAAALLRVCDVERHGVDLFNRDPLLLGRLLITLVSAQKHSHLYSSSCSCHFWHCSSHADRLLPLLLVHQTSLSPVTCGRSTYVTTARAFHIACPCRDLHNQAGLARHGLCHTYSALVPPHAAMIYYFHIVVGIALLIVIMNTINAIIINIAIDMSIVTTCCRALLWSAWVQPL